MSVFSQEVSSQLLAFPANGGIYLLDKVSF